MITKVRNFKSPKGNSVPNQFLLTEQDGTEIYQSYKTTIAVKTLKGKVFLDKDSWDYGHTTSKYRNEFLGEKIKDTRKKIESGEYKLVDLNEANKQITYANIEGYCKPQIVYSSK